MNSIRGWFAAACVLCAPALACDSADPPPRRVPLAEIEVQVGNVICGPQFSCGCPSEQLFYESEAQCRDVARTLANDLRSTISDNNLQWDPLCLGANLQIIEAAGCDPSFAVEEPDDDDECVAPCNMVHGDKTAGQPCQWFGSGYSDCAQGLDCNGSECVDPCATGPTGPAGNCYDGCGTGYVCDWSGEIDGVCVPIPEAGQPCPQGACAGEAFCELEDPNDPMTQLVCKTPVEIGESCRGHSQCRSGYCPAGFCDELPGEGESCRGTFVCSSGLDCVPENPDQPESSAFICAAGAPAICDISIPLPGL